MDGGMQPAASADSGAQPEVTGLALLRRPFPAHKISKLPKPTKAQTEAVRADYKTGIRCDICGTWHHPKVVHLDYVGHAALTDRLLECDPAWNWEPMALSAAGTPLMDQNGGMWIKLTVCGVTRYGYGHPDGKTGGDAIKEVIGDALRNAAMRFGAALELWHKGELHGRDQDGASPQDDAAAPMAAPPFNAAAARDRVKRLFESANTVDDLAERWASEAATIRDIAAASPAMKAEIVAAKNKRKAELSSRPASAADLGGDRIPY